MIDSLVLPQSWQPAITLRFIQWEDGGKLGKDKSVLRRLRNTRL
jgi:hypothetical protein